MANLIIQITKALACAKRIESILAVENSQQIEDLTQQAKAETDDVIRFEHVGLTYQGGGEESLKAFTTFSFPIISSISAVCSPLVSD